LKEKKRKKLIRNEDILSLKKNGLYFSKD